MPNESQTKLIFAGTVSLTTAWTGYVRARGLDPQSLWFDDLWVASLTRLDSLLSVVTLPVPAPPGFVGVLWLAKRLVPDPEVSMQVVPFIASLIVIPLLALLVVAITRSYGLGVIGGCLVALNPNIAHYSVFVKQYTLDVLATTVLLLIAARFFRTQEPKYLRIGAIAGVGCLLFSFPSVFASVVFINLALLHQLTRIEVEPSRAGPIVRSAIAFDVVLVILFILVIGGRSNARLAGYFSAGYMSLDSLQAAWSFVSTRGLRALQGGLPPIMSGAALLAAVGCVWLVVKPQWRWFGLFLLLFYLAVLVASSLQLYPISGGPLDQPTRSRTDLFSYPVTILLVMAGLGAGVNWIPRRTLVTLPLCAMALGLVALRPAMASYFPLDHSRFVRLMDGLAQEDDGIVLWPAAQFLAGYYSVTPIRAFTRPRLDNELEIRLNRPNALTLHPRSPEARSEALESFLRAGEYRRIIYLTTRARDGQQDPVFAALARHGYVEAQRWSSTVRTHLVVYQRTEVAEDSS